VNDLLREHVTRTGFDLSLSKRQVESLVWLCEMRESLRYGGRGPSHYVSSIHGAMRRGLVVHRADRASLLRHERENRPLGWYYELTAAGEFVVGLLRESGLYEEHERVLFPDRFTRTGRRRALRAAS